MIKSYIKLALKVLQRKKFFTFISLFGISFTLMILTLLTSFLENELGKHAPLSDKDKMLFLKYVTMRQMVPDTILTIDSTLVNGQLTYDTTQTYDRRQRSMSRSSYSFHLLDQHLRRIQGVENYSFYAPGYIYTLFKNGQKISLDGIYTDGNYWNIFDFTFLEGGPYKTMDVKNQAQYAVITDKTGKEYFGASTNLVGREIIIENKHFKVVGVIQQPTTNHDAIQCNIYIPYTNMPPYVFDDPTELLGPFEAALVAPTEASKQIIRDDLERIGQHFAMPEPEEYNDLTLNNVTFTEQYADDLMDQDTPKESLSLAKWVLFFLLGLFILLPTLNLININISRILERSSEIGVRKSFGANASQILLQFVFENIILTFLGGVIGLVLAFLAIYLINDSQVLPNTYLHINGKVFFYSLLICLGFGILSGIIPAYRMSKLPIAQSLKQNVI